MKNKYYIQDESGVILTCHSDIEMEEAWETITNPLDASIDCKAKYLRKEPVGNIKLLKVIAIQNFIEKKIHSEKQRPHWH